MNKLIYLNLSPIHAPPVWVSAIDWAPAYNPCTPLRQHPPMFHHTLVDHPLMSLVEHEALRQQPPADLMDHEVFGPAPYFEWRSLFILIRSDVMIVDLDIGGSEYLVYRAHGWNIPVFGVGVSTYRSPFVEARLRATVSPDNMDLLKELCGFIENSGQTGQ